MLEGVGLSFEDYFGLEKIEILLGLVRLFLIINYSDIVNDDYVWELV